MVEAIKEWALATVQAVKTRAQETGGELKGAVQRRWGVKRVGRRNAFASTGHRQKEEPGTGGPLARARNHHAHHDFEVF